MPQVYNAFLPAFSCNKRFGGFRVSLIPWPETNYQQRNKLARVIGGYSDRLALQRKEALREPDVPEIRPVARISQYANSRQRLSVQSLLLQSDFVDDSDQIAVSAQALKASDQQRDEGDHISTEVPALDDRMSLDGINEETLTPHGLEGLEDTGSELNPWMGFPGKDDVYGIPGLSGSLDAEY